MAKKATREKKSPGRHTKLTDDLKARAYDFVCKYGLVEFGGATILKFIKYLGIDYETYYRWIGNRSDDEKITEFAKIIESARQLYKENFEKELVKSLQKNALGFTAEYKEEKYVVNKSGDKVLVESNVKTKVFAPNTGAGIFLLTNMNPDVWKNKLSQDVEAKVDAKVSANGFSINIEAANKEAAAEINKEVVNDNEA